MYSTVIKVISLIFTTLVFGSAFAHLLEMFHKMQFSKDEYLLVQQIYQGWSILGILIFLDLISISLLAANSRHQPFQFRVNVLAFFFVLAALVIFFIFTFPANRQTVNWTELPSNWEILRLRWETSHAISAILYFIALVLLFLGVVRKKHQIWV
jgi:hypothetical protein